MNNKNNKCKVFCVYAHRIANGEYGVRSKLLAPVPRKKPARSYQFWRATRCGAVKRLYPNVPKVLRPIMS